MMKDIIEEKDGDRLKMKISTKYIIEFSSENTTEIIAVCKSIRSVKDYLIKKFDFADKEIYTDEVEGYVLIIKLNYGKIQVRKIDFVDD